jgi:hypothetical protein
MFHNSGTDGIMKKRYAFNAEKKAKDVFKCGRIFRLARFELLFLDLMPIELF